MTRQGTSMDRGLTTFAYGTGTMDDPDVLPDRITPAAAFELLKTLEMSLFDRSPVAPALRPRAAREQVDGPPMFSQWERDFVRQLAARADFGTRELKATGKQLVIMYRLAHRLAAVVGDATEKLEL